MTGNFSTYQSAFSWRYGSSEMRKLFSEENRRKTWRMVWVSLAKAQAKEGLISKSELEDIIKNQNKIDIETAHKFEESLKHDLMAEVMTYAQQAKIGGGKIHFGATSQDIEDNADPLIYLQALEIIETSLKKLLKIWSIKITENKNLICMAYTHLQPAEPTTMGYRFSTYAQDLLLDLELLKFVKSQIKGKGIKGAVGNSASYVSIIGQKAKNLEKNIMSELGLDAFDVSTQVYPRKIDYLILIVLSSIAQSLYKFAFDVRILQSSPFGELSEPFGEKQVGSSAMPFKRNPQNSEKVCSLARYISNLSKTAWDNAGNSLLERTLDDSASRRVIMPDGFLATDEILTVCLNIVMNLKINTNNVKKNLEQYGPFSSLEAILLLSTKKGANRQEMHEILRMHSLKVYDEVQNGDENNLNKYIKQDKTIRKYLSEKELSEAADYKKHIGFSSEKSQQTVRKIQAAIK